MYKQLIYNLLLFNLIFIPQHVISKSKVGKINIATNPQGVVIFIDGKEFGKTPIENEDIAYGKHILTLSVNQFKSIEQTFLVTKKNPCISLYYPITLVNILGYPTDAKIKLDDQNVGKLPLENLIVPLGNHKLKISKAGFYSHKDNSYLINKRQVYKSNIFLKPKSRMYATLMSTIIPGSGQIYSGRKLGFINGLSTIGTVALYISAHNSYKKAKDQYIIDYNNYHQYTEGPLWVELYSKMNSSYDTMKQKHNMYKITLGIAATAWLYNIVDAYFFFPKNNKAQFSINNNAEFTVISLNINF